MPTQTAALALLGAPYKSHGEHTAPVQFASAVDPDGTVRGLAAWLESLAESLEGGPHEIVGEALSTLRRGAARFSGLAAA